MYTALQSLYVRGHAGDPLPKVWDSLDQRGTKFLRGQLCLVCAGPGTGKSAFVLTYALRASVPTLYVSADSDSFTQISRSLSILTGDPLSKTANAVRSGRLSPEYEQVLESLPIRFRYDASPSIKQIEDWMAAYDEVYGDFPALVVTDNITNIRAGGDNDDDPFSGLEALMEYLHDMARGSGACVVGLHHVTGGYNDADRPIPLSGVKGQISRVPEMILTMHRIQETFGSDTLRVSTVKNRGGKADPSGLDYVELNWVGDTMQIRDKSTSNT